MDFVGLSNHCFLWSQHGSDENRSKKETQETPQSQKPDVGNTNTSVVPSLQRLRVKGKHVL